MRYSNACWTLASFMVLGLPSAAVPIEWTLIGDPGNPSDRGASVDHAYYIGTYEVTNAQYAEFLNAKAAASDPYHLFIQNMSFGTGGIVQSGAVGSYSYAAISGRENMPVNYVSFIDAIRFANWLNNGMGAADTETGAYTLLPGPDPATPSNRLTVTRNAGAEIFVPTQSEWIKAAYYDASTASSFLYPTRSNDEPTCSVPTSVGNTANCGNQVGDLTAVGSYANSASPYGTFDQGGNVGEWTETIPSAPTRFFLGGSYLEGVGAISASTINGPQSESSLTGFRLARAVPVPEPVTGALAAWGMIGFAAQGRARRRAR
jgi:formylglycine-generating enzyme required for sulfatase activity